MAKKIVFMQLQSHPAYDNVMEELRKHFPGLEIDLINVRDLVRQQKTVKWVNLFFVLKMYGFEILLGRKKLRSCIYRTPYMFRKVKNILSKRLSQGDYEFSFQFQALFDGSKESLPHYIYTDHTQLTLRTYPAFGKSALFGQRNLFGPKWIELEKTIYNNATINFTMSSNITDSIIRDYSCPPEKVVCVYGGSSVGTYFEVDEKKYRNKEILFVGLEWERKGGPELAEAFKRVLEVHPTARLTIVGCTPKLNIPNCDIVGQVPLANLSHYYERASVFCLPTRLEPFGIVFLEAYAYGLPVVATDLGAIPDFVLNGETGYRVKYGDIEHLSDVLIDLIGNAEKCQTLGENGRRLVAEKYSWEKVGDRMTEAILATINNG